MPRAKWMRSNSKNCILNWICQKNKMENPENKELSHPNEEKNEHKFEEVYKLLLEFTHTISNEPNFIKMRSGYYESETSVPILYQKLQKLTQTQIRLRDAATEKFENIKKTL